MRITKLRRRGGVVACSVAWTLLGATPTAAAQAGQAADPLEFSCAAFPPPLAESDLVARFGAENVVTDSIIGSDDGPFLGTVVRLDDGDARIEVAWRDAADRRAARWARIHAPRERWETAQGLRLGNDLRSVERANGWPFRLSGFSQEGGLGGAVLSWGRGRLGRDTLDTVCSERIVFQHRYDGSAPAEALRQVDRLREVSSGHPAMQAINPTLVAVVLVYARGGGRRSP